MKLKTPTVFLVGIAVILGIVVFAELQGGDRTASDEEGQPLFSFEEEDVQSFTIENFLGTLSFEKDEENAWQMIEPEPYPANEASVSFFLNLLATGESDRTLAVSADEVMGFGLEPPQATVDIMLEDAITHQLLLGDFDFSQQSIYAQIDPSKDSATNGTEDDIEVVLVPSSFDTAVNRPIEDWQQLEPDAVEEDIPEETSPEEATSEEITPEETVQDNNESGDENSESGDEKNE